MEGKTSWGRLPAEIRLSILEALIQDGCSLASLAAVSRDWQATVERHNFARIRLTPSRLPHFDSIVYRRRALVRYIWVCLELGEYFYCYVPQELGESRQGDWETDNSIMITALDDLFSALSKWEPQGDLLLDISVHSPSDSEYWFKELTCVPDFPSVEECGRALAGTAEAKRARIANDKNPHYVWAVAPPRTAIGSTFAKLMYGEPFGTSVQQPEWWRRLPAAPTVTGLLLRQQTRRRWDPAHVAWLLARLPRVRGVHFEFWREWEFEDQVIADQSYFGAGYEGLFDCLGFMDLERLVLFENFDQRYLPALHRHQPLRISHADVSLALSRASRGLKHLSASFIVDADYFFAGVDRNPDWTWPRLASLALTLLLLQPDVAVHESREVLIMAARAAKRMPSLETMELWFGNAGVAGMFRYRSSRSGRTASITWRGTWDLKLGDKVVRAWEAVANKDRRAGLVVVKEEVLDASKIRFHGDAIHHLGLEAEVVRPISLGQMRMERDIRP